MSVGGDSLERYRPGSTSLGSARSCCRGFGSSGAWWGNRWGGRGYGGSLFPCFWMRRKQWRRYWTFSDTREVGKMRRAEVPCDREAGELDDELAERAWGCCLFCVCFPLPFLLGVWGAAVDALEAAEETTTGMLEGEFMLSAECTSRVIINFIQNKNHYCSLTASDLMGLACGCAVRSERSANHLESRRTG
jgi:hypothetical protein